MSLRFASSSLAVAALLFSLPAAAQDEAQPAPVAPAPAEPPAPAPAAPALAASASVAPELPAADAAKQPSVSVTFERLGGIAYANASASQDDSSLSLTAIGVGGVTPNPFAIPRIGVDYILPSNLTLGGAVGLSYISASAHAGSQSQDIGSVFLYTLTPRVGYRIPLSDRVDFTPRAGLTLAGASASPADSQDKASIFAVAIGADAPFAFRVTDSFNLLAGAAVDYTVSATVSTTTTSTTFTGGPTGGTSTSTSSRSDDVKGALFSLQGWIGVGGYL